jgi:hypothetical protein
MATRMTKADRCDRCGSEAFYLAMKGDQHLLFCAHHGRKFEERLIDTGWEILDESHRINVQPSESASV